MEWPKGAPAEGSCRQTCWESVGQGKGRSSKRAPSALAQPAALAVAPRPRLPGKGRGLSRGRRDSKGRALSAAAPQQAACSRACRPLRAIPSNPRFSPCPRQKCKTFTKCAVPRRLGSPRRTAVLSPRAYWDLCARLGSQSGCARAGEERVCERACRARAETHVPPPLSSG